MLFGGPSEGRVLGRLLAMCREPVPVLAGSSSLPLLSFAALAPKLSLMVTNDTGPMHLAAATGTRLVALFGSTRPDLTGPVGDGHRCLHIADLRCAGCYRRRCPYNLECLTGISVETVMQAIQGMLAHP